MPNPPETQPAPQREPSMRDLVKSMAGFSWAMSLFGVRGMGAFMAPGKTAASLDSVTRATEEQLGGLRGLFRAGDQLQRGMIDMMMGGGGPAGAPGAPPGAPGAPGSPGAPAGGPAAGPPPPPVHSGRLNTSSFVALGEGLAAGAADFFLSEELQRESFPAQMARQMQTPFAQPLLQAPGIGNLPGFQRLPVEVPALMQTTVLEPFPAPAPGNLSVPGFRLTDALHHRPTPPLVHGDDAVRTACNLILGMPAILGAGEGPFPTQLEVALLRRPSLALIELGYLEAIEAAVAGDPALLPETARFRADLSRLVEALRAAGSEVLVMNVPDPLDTAFVATLDAAARTVKASSAFLREAYGLKADDLVTPRGLIEIGFQLLSRSIGALPAGSVLGMDAARRIGGRVGELNGALADVAREHGAHVCDLHGLVRSVRAQGVQAGARRLTADYLGGFYSLNGYYPGKTGHALIANQALALLNQVYGADFPALDLAAVAATDPVVLYQPAEGPDLPVGQMPPPPSPVAGGSAAAPRQPAAPAVMVRETSGPWPPAQAAPKPLELPPGLEQVLPLNKERSYFGDALRAVDCQSPQAAKWGGCGGVLFGGLALVDSHVSGEVRIRFSPPVDAYGTKVSHFEVSVGNGLRGDDGTLAAPQLYKLPAQQNQVTDFPGMVSAGDLDLTTGLAIEGSLKFNFGFLNTALLALIRVNPHFPQVPIQFPGQYGTAMAQFTQRPDGKLDFDFFGSTFLPLGNDLGGLPVRFPLPFAGATFQFASIPSRGVALHPHISLSTREEPLESWGDVAEIPTNTVREYTFNSHNTSFGDDFHLNSPVLGGMARGRSQLVGRLHVQFGERAGNSVPIYVSAMNPGGYLQPMEPSPISMGFEQVAPGGRLTPGPYGFDETLRFPLRSYGLDDVFLLSDPFDLSVAAVDVRTGAVLGEQVHRGFIGQDLFFALIRVEPRTPQGSFYFHGPALFQKTPSGQTVYRFFGEVHIPYPEGFLFPEPNLAQGFPAGPDSALDPFFWIQAMDGGNVPPQTVKKGSASDIVASTGDLFSYTYEIPADPARHRPKFEYTNHSQQGSFRLHSLTWVSFLNARAARPRKGDFDTVAFAGFGTWSKGGDFFQPASVVISTAADAPYVGIQIGDGGAVSNVNTKPPNPDAVRP